ncbi:MAG: serine/threonine protein kinase, partial [Bdellovibrionales bacterium]|nr:serine/threonine protein kinase [Bdellovibrionales bacterium]
EGELTMDADLEPVYLRILQATHPEDIFGCEDIVLPVDTLLAYLEREYERLRSVVRPEAYANPADREAAAEALTLLERQYEEGRRRIREMTYGIVAFGTAPPTKLTRSFTIGPRRFYVGPKLGEGARSTLYQGFLEENGILLGEVVLKLATTRAANPSMLRERRLLDILHSTDVPQWRHLPYPLERFEAGARLGIAYRKIKGFPLTAVRQHPEHRRGVDQRHMIWMLDRLLSVLGYVHAKGVVHGTLVPEHLVVQPAVHNVCIAGGWGSAVHEPACSGERIAEHFEAFSAPEVRTGGRIGPWSDLYSLGKVMIWLVGGDPVENRIPATVEQDLQAFLLDLVEERVERRPSDAWELFHLQNELKDSLWPRKFLPFNMQ